MFRWSIVIACILLAVRISWAQSSKGSLDAMVASHAAANGVPASLVRRVVMRESRYNPRAVSRGNYGLMQIRLGTARAMGYRGSAQGLLDPNTNMTYAVRYLAGAYRAAGGNEARAISYYQSGYYYAAKRRGVQMASGRSRAERSYAQFTPTFGAWELAAAPSPRRQRTASYAAQPTFSLFNVQATQYAAPTRQRNLRYATARTTSLFNWRLAQATPAKQARHSRRVARHTPDLAQTLQRWFSQQRVRMARLNRTALH